MCLMYIVATRIACCQRYRMHHYYVSPLTSSRSVLKCSIYFCVKVGRNHRRDVNHLPFLQNSKKCFVTRSIDKFSCRISTRRIILAVEVRAWDKQIDYFRAIRTGTEFPVGNFPRFILGQACFKLEFFSYFFLGRHSIIMLASCLFYP